MSDQSIGEELVRTLAGDLGAFAMLSRHPHSELERCAKALPRLILNREGLRNVLIAFQRGDAPPELVMKWAWFVRSGVVSGGSGPIMPLDIDYDPETEDMIAHVVSRVSELGDLIDGEISPAELDEMIRGLSD